MALRFVSATRDCIVRVTDDSPSARLDTVSGTIPVDVIGVVGFNVMDTRGRWHYIELPDAHVCSSATVELYPVQLGFTVHRLRHFFDDINEIRLPDGSRLPFMSAPDGYPLSVVYGPPVEDAILHTIPSAPARPAQRPSKTGTGGASGQLPVRAFEGC